jgi:eukaryotic-like serine/threonine-protein kinase
MIDIGSSVGNYHVRAKLGEGGMGMVFMAEHPLIGRKVAIKVISPAYAANPEAVSRFFTEAQAVNRIGHANIVDVTDFGQTPDGECYCVMEFLSGQSLADRMKTSRLSLVEALHIATQVCDALSASHTNNILHRDLKPDNIFLTKRGGDPSFVKVLDFGLAKLTTEEKVGHKTRAGTVMGTPYYMSPEQCMGKGTIDSRADVYSVGVILFEMVTGRVPFTGEGYGEVLVKHMTEMPAPVRSLNPQCPEWLEGVIAMCLAKNADARIASMSQLHDFLSHGMASTPELSLPAYAGGLPQPSRQSFPQLAPISHPPPAHPTTLGLSSGESSVVSHPPRPPRRTGLFIGAGLGLLLAGGAAAFLATRSSGAPATQAAVPTEGLEAVDPPSVPPPAIQPPVVAAPVSAPPVVQAPVVPQKVGVQLESEPAGVTVTLGGKSIGVTPFEWSTDPSDTPVTLTFAIEGYQPRTKQIIPSKAQTISVELVAIPKPVAAVKRPPVVRQPVRQPVKQPVKQPVVPVKKPGEGDTDLMAPQ